MIRYFLALLLLLPVLAQADISFVASRYCESANTATSSKVVTCAPPAGTEPGDLVVYAAFARSNQGVNTISVTRTPSWTMWGSEQELGSSNTRHVLGEMGYRVATAADDDPATDLYSITVDDADAAALLSVGYAVATFRNAYTGSPYDATYAKGSHFVYSDSTVVRCDAPDITNRTIGAWVLTMSGTDLSNVTAIGAPSGLTLRASSVGTARNFGLATLATTTSGAQSIGAWTNTDDGSLGSDRTVCMTTAIVPKRHIQLIERRTR